MPKLDPKNDVLLIQDTSAGDCGGVSPFELISSVLLQPSGSALTMTKDVTTGKIALDISSSAFLSAATRIVAGQGLAGGGDLSANRMVWLDVASLSAAGAVDMANDYIPIHDASAGGTRRVPLSMLLGSRVSSGTTVFAGSGLSGGGNLSANRTLSLDVGNLPATTSLDDSADYIPIFDASSGVTRRARIDTLIDNSASTPRPMGTI